MCLSVCLLAGVGCQESKLARRDSSSFFFLFREFYIYDVEGGFFYFYMIVEEEVGERIEEEFKGRNEGLKKRLDEFALRSV